MLSFTHYEAKTVEPLLRDMAKANAYLLVNNVGAVAFSDAVQPGTEGTIPALFEVSPRDNTEKPDGTRLNEITDAAKAAGVLVFDMRIAAKLEGSDITITDEEKSFGMAWSIFGPPQPSSDGIRDFLTVVVQVPRIVEVSNRERFLN